MLLLFLYNYCDYLLMNSLKNRLLYVIVLHYAGPYSPNGLLIFGYIWVYKIFPGPAHFTYDVSYHFFGARDTYLFITNNHRIRIKNSNFCCKRSRNCPQCDNHETSYREVAIELYRIHVVVWTIFTYLYSIPYIYIFQYWTHFLMYEK